jgi:uncharacterized phiE125 gp8 family phage protein
MMLTIERTPIATGDTVDAADLQEHMRLDADLVAGSTAYVQAASAEVEGYCALALLDQTITVTTGTLPGRDIRLPVGPVAPDADITVHLIELDGSTTLVPDEGYWLEGGLYPALRFTEGEPGGRLRITYTAGYGDTSADVPADLRMAICDLAARLYDYRASEKAATMPAATARICARYRRVKAGA